MRIAVTSQNRKIITEHAGRCRNFWVFDVNDGRVAGRSLLELPKEASLHDSSPDSEHPLDGVDVLISRGMGDGLRARLARRGIQAVVTIETDPQRAVESWLAGSLAQIDPHQHAHGVDHDLDHRHQLGCSDCGCRPH